MSDKITTLTKQFKKNIFQVIYKLINSFYRIAKGAIRVRYAFLNKVPNGQKRLS